jgi:hypothetical protein
VSGIVSDILLMLLVCVQREPCMDTRSSPGSVNTIPISHTTKRFEVEWTYANRGGQQHQVCSIGTMDEMIGREY